MLLATDLDGTFLAGTQARRHQLYQLISQHPEIELIFVTGRGLESVMPLLADPTIPQPAYIICDVGATIVDGGTLQPVQPLQSNIDSLWPGEYVIEKALADFPGLVRQDVPQNGRCSFFCDASAVTDNLYEIASALGCDLLYSADHYLDFLPVGVNKGSSLLALTQELAIDPQSVLVAGDTLNDLSMYQHDFLGVCVGASEFALLNSTKDQAKIYHANKEGCGGILEAFSYFNFLGSEGIQAELQEQEVIPGKSDLVIVYHRLPYEEYLEKGVVKRRNPSSPNGIIPTLLSFFGDGKSGSWVAWSTMKSDDQDFETHTAVDTKLYPNLRASRVPLSNDQVDIFYKKFSKEAFWPTLHTFWERAKFREDHWLVFLEVNRLFAEQASKEAAEGATVWIHDYNLWMVPGFLREMRSDITIAFFHHTYFPSADVFNVLPWRRDIIGSLLQCDFIGFHIPRQSENFIDVVKGITPIKVCKRVNCAPRFVTYGCAVGLDEMTAEIEVNERRIGLGALPVGLDLSRITDALDMPSIQQKTQQLRDELQHHRIILSVERLDYTKGIVSKLEAFELLLEEHPELIGDVVLLTICVPAAKEMNIYNELQIEIEQTIGRINGRYGQVGWTPVQFFFRSFPFEDLVAYYALADVMWITPLRDGLNLVAKEFIATQGFTDGKGVLVLSEFAGAAAELKGILLTNPHDIHDLANVCYLALNIDDNEAKDRIREAFSVVKYNDITHWGDEFMEAIDQCRRRRRAGLLKVS
jgi:glucosylglycerol-phosphate synthase